MFTYSIVSKDFFNGQLKVSGKFTDGTNSFTEDFVVSNKNHLSNQIKNRIRQLDEMQLCVNDLTLGAYTPEEDVTTTISQDDIDKQKWFRDFQRLEALTKLNSLSALRPALLTELDTLRTTVATNFKKAYIADM